MNNTKHKIIELSAKVLGGEMVTQYDEELYLKLYPYSRVIDDIIGTNYLPPQLNPPWKTKPKSTLWKLKRFWRCKKCHA